MTEERRICCCGASGWTRFIAWIQILYNGFVVILYVFSLLALIAAAHEYNKGLVGREEKDDTKTALTIGFVLVAIELVLSLTGFIMGIILLKGSKQGNTNYLQAWLIYAIICLIFSIIMAVAGGVGGTHGTTLASVILNVAFNVIIYGFGIWVVRVHIREIDQTKYGADDA